MKVEPRLRSLLIAVGLTGLACFLLRDVLFFGRAFFERDLLWVYFPLAEAFVRAAAEGALPLRDPTSGFGQPLLAIPSMQVLYPPTWFHLLLAPDRAFSVIVLLHFLIGGSGAAALCFRWSKSRSSSLLAGAFWMLSGPFLSALNLWHHFDGAMWTPWVLLAFDRLLEQPTWRAMLLLGAAFGSQGLAGSADLCIMSALLVVLRLLCESRRLADPGPRRGFLLSLGSLFLAIALAAGVWMPALEILQFSSRSALSREERTDWSIHPTVAIEWLFPTQIGSLPLNPSARDRLTDGRPPFLRSVFLGPLVLPLMIAGLMNGMISRRVRAFLALGILLSALGALGRNTPVYDWLVAIAPPLALCRYPAKGVLPLSLLVSVLASLGVASLATERVRRAAASVALAMSLLSGLLYLNTPGLLAGLLDPSNAVSMSEAVSRVQSGLELSALLLLLMAVSMIARHPWGVRGVLALCLALTFWINRDLNPTIPRGVLAFRPPYANLFNEGGQGRLYAFDYLHYPARSAQIFERSSLIVPEKLAGLDSATAFVTVVRSGLMAPTGGAWGIEYAWDYDLYGLSDLTLRGLNRYMRQMEGQPVFLRMLQLGNVTSVAALHTSTFGALTPEGAIPLPLPEPLYVYRVPQPLPRGYAVSGARRLDTKKAQEVILDPAFDPRAEITIDRGVDTPLSPSFASTVVITNRRSDRLELDAVLNEPGHVVIVEGFLPGWHATVDGVDVPVRRTNALFVSAPAPAGRHLVVFSYRPVTALVGVGLTALTALGLLIALARRPLEVGGR